VLLWLFQVARLVPLLLVFAVAACQDYRKGEVSNKLWLYAPVGLVLTVLELVLFSPFLFWYAVVSMVFTSVFSVVLFYSVKRGFGGADAKALITLSASFPLGGFLWFYPLACLVFAGLLVGLKFLLSRNRGFEVRYLPYLLAGMLLALV
jgi:hypothetical protein